MWRLQIPSRSKVIHSQWNQLTNTLSSAFAPVRMPISCCRRSHSQLHLTRSFSAAMKTPSPRWSGTLTTGPETGVRWSWQKKILLGSSTAWKADGSGWAGAGDWSKWQKDRQTDNASSATKTTHRKMFLLLLFQVGLETSVIGPTCIHQVIINSILYRDNMNNNNNKIIIIIIIIK